MWYPWFFGSDGIRLANGVAKECLGRSVSDDEFFLPFPIELLIPGTAVSLQASPAGRARWKETIGDHARFHLASRGEFFYIDDSVLSVTILYFPSGPMQGDVATPTPILEKAMKSEPPVLYIRVDDDLGWRVLP